MRFKARRRNPARSRVGTNRVVEGFQIEKHVVLCGSTGRKLSEVNELTFETAEKIVSNRVVVGVAFTRHALADALGSQPVTTGFGRVLAAAVAVENQALGRLAAAVSHVQSRQCQLRINAI